MSGDSSGRRREVARRAFAKEFNDSTTVFTETNEDRAPKYALLRTGQKANRLFVIGTLSETADVGDESEYWQARVVDPTGTFFVYAGEYQPDASEFLAETEPPAFVAIVGKPRRYETDSGSTNMSLRPESIVLVGKGARERWIVDTARLTIQRLEYFRAGGSHYVEMAIEEYGEEISEYHQSVITALESLDESVETS